MAKENFQNSRENINDKSYLSNIVWINETYVKDISIDIDPGDLAKRGLSKEQICILVAIDCCKNVFVKKMVMANLVVIKYTML